MGTELQPLSPDKPDQSQDRPLLKSEENSGQITPEDLSELEKRFAAYVRKDLYGSMGHGELPLAEKIKIGLAMITLVPIRVVVGILLVVVYYAVCRACTLLKKPDEQVGEEGQDGYGHLRGWRRKVIVGCGRVLARLMLVVFGFYWISVVHRSRTEDQNKAQHQEEQERPGAIVSNHVSYIDILYHMSSEFPSFVAKRSVGKLPLVGIISKCLGCVFVQRESKSSDFKGVAGAVTERVWEAHQNIEAPTMMLFPEGTTTNGEYLLPFKTGAFLSKAPVRPVILKYPYQKFSPAWDSMSGVSQLYQRPKIVMDGVECEFAITNGSEARHVIFLLCQFINHMEVTYLPVYCPSQEEKDDAKLYANNVRKLMAMEGNLIMSDIGLAEKRVYHNALNGLVCQG